MNNFNNVFLAVKACCGELGINDDPNCFDALAKATKIPIPRLDFYLNTLESIGLIKYSIDKGYIKLTPYGKLKESYLPTS